MAGGLNPDFTTMLRFDECVGILDQWLNEKLGGEPGSLKLKSSKGNKHNVEWRSNKTKNNGYIIDNPLSNGYSNAVGIFYIGGQQHKTNVMGAIKDLEGENGPISEMIKERYIEQQKNEGVNYKEIPKQTPEEIEAALQRQKDRELADTRIDLLSRMPGVAVAQYAYLAAKAQVDPAFHYGQGVQAIDDHPYMRKKGFQIDQQEDDIYIISKMSPTNEQMINFINTDHFIVPKNEFGIDKKEIINLINDPKFNFSYNKYILTNDIKTGIGIATSRDPDGVITNLQKFLIDKIKAKGGSVDKIFLPDAIVSGSAHIFNHAEKTDPNYNPKNIFIHEGWATGKTTLKAVKNDPDSMVLVAWNAGQIKNIVDVYLKKYPEANIIEVADNDCKSFFNMNKKSEQDLERVKNTGLQAALEAYALNKEDQHRIGILVPRINYKTYSADKDLSDFNDIEMKFGQNKAIEELGIELTKLYERKQAKIPESDRIVKLYNEQAQHYSDKYGLEVRGIDNEGSLTTVKITPKNPPAPKEPEITIEVATPEPTKAVDAPEELAMPYQQDGDISSFFNKPINNAIKSDFDKKMEEGIGLLVGSKPPVSEQLQQNILEPSPKDIVTNNYNPKLEDAPAIQPIVDPADFTLMLYQNSLIMQYAEIANKPNKEQMMEALDSNVHSMSSALRALNVLLDSTTLPHVSATIDKVMDGYQDKPFYQDLVQIKDFANEQFIQKNAVDMNELKAFHKNVSDIYLCNNRENGFDSEVTAKMVESAISRKPIEEKREFYREFVNSLRNLEGDSQWLKDVSSTLQTSYSHAVNKSEQANELNVSKENNLENKNKGPSNDFNP